MDTLFVDKQTQIIASWLNDVNAVTYRQAIPMFPSGGDDTSALIAAFATAYAAGNGVFLARGNFNTTGSIPHFHQVPKYGPGVIIRNGSVTFVPNLNWTQTNTLYLNPVSGDDGQDGLSPTEPMKTGQAVMNALAYYGPHLNGTWKASLAAGTYTEGFALIANLTSLNPIQINGPTGVLPFTPTAIIDGTTAVDNFGIYLPGRNNVAVNDVLIQNFSTAGYFGVVGQEFSTMNLTHVYVNNCDNGVKSQESRTYMGQACVITGGTVGVTIISQDTYTLGYNCTSTGTTAAAGMGPYINGCSQAGLLVQETGDGHFDHSTANNCAVGIDLIVNSRVNLNNSTLTNNVTCAVRGRESSSVADTTGNTFTGNGTKFLLYSGSGEITRTGSWSTARRHPIDLTFVGPTSGIITDQVVKTYANDIDIANFNIVGGAYKITIAGTITGVNSTKGLKVRCDGSDMFGFAIGSVAGDFVLEGEFISNGLSAQSYWAKLSINGQTVQSVQGSRSITLSAGTVTILETIANAGDSISIRSVTREGYLGA